MKSQKSKTLLLDKNHFHTIIQSFNHSKGRTLVWLYGCLQSINIKFLLFIVFSLLLSACDEGPPIPEKKFMKAYVDLLIAKDTTTTPSYSPDSLKSFVLSRYKISMDQYNSMLEYYNDRPQEWISFFDSTMVYVEKLKQKAENQP